MSLLGDTRERFPRVKEYIGEDPARYLDQELDAHGRELVEARIRGIDYLATVRAWIAVERSLGRGPGGGPRPEVIKQLEEREAYLDAEGDRDERLDLDAARRLSEEQRSPDALGDVETAYVHADCEGDVERRGDRAYHCSICDHAVPQSAVLEVVEAEGVSA